MDYNHLIAFCKNQQLDKVVMASDIMSYHHESYDYPHQNNDFKKLESKLKRFVYNIILVHVKRLTIKGTI